MWMTYPADYKLLVQTLSEQMGPYVFSNVSSPPVSGEERCSTLCAGKAWTPARTPGSTGENSVRMPTLSLTITTSDIRPLLLRHGFHPRKFSNNPDDVIRYLDPDDSYCVCHLEGK